MIKFKFMEVYKNQFQSELEKKHGATLNLLKKVRYDLALEELHQQKCPDWMYQNCYIRNAESFADFLVCMTSNPNECRLLNVNCFSITCKKA